MEITKDVLIGHIKSLIESVEYLADEYMIDEFNECLIDAKCVLKQVEKEETDEIDADNARCKFADGYLKHNSPLAVWRRTGLCERLTKEQRDE